MFVSSPGCFLLVSLIIAVTAAALCELERSRLAEASRKEKEFNQILKALKRSEEEEVKCWISSQGDVASGILTVHKNKLFINTHTGGKVRGSP